MNVFQSCNDTSDATPLSSSQGLYLKPVAKLNISVQLPNLKQPGKSVSNWEVMEKLRYYAAPEEFVSLKVSKSTLEIVRFEGEIEYRSKLNSVLARLDGRYIKISGFQEGFKVKAAEAKPDFPSRHSWDSYFRDAKNMNEMKPGERPDTIHLTNLPCKWFATKSDDSKPSEYILRKVFECFGEIRCIDIPMLDPYRSQMKPHISGMKMFSNNQNMIFEAYIQFNEYMCFLKTMDTLRGMKLLYIDPVGKAFSASIKVDFDKTKHLSDSSIRRRRFEREKLMAKEREREDKELRAREEVERKQAEERKRLEEQKAAKQERQRQREERRKAKQLEKLNHREADEMNKKIATEERLLMIAQRRLESFRLLGELFNRLKVAKEKKLNKHKGKISHRKIQNSFNDQEEFPGRTSETTEKELREKLVMKFKQSEATSETKTTGKSMDGKIELDTNAAAEYQPFDYSYNEFHTFNRGGTRGFWRGRPSRRRRGNMPFRGNHFIPMPLQPFHHRKPFFYQKEQHWDHFPTRARGAGNPGIIPQALIDPYYLEAALNDPYYKYFNKITHGDHKRSRSRSSRTRSRSRTSRTRSRSSRSRSRSSRSRSRSSRSRSRSSRTRSYSRSKSYSRSPSRSHRRRSSSRCSSNRSRHHRSRNRRRRTRSHSRSKSKQRSRSHKNNISHDSSNVQKNPDTEKSAPEEKVTGSENTGCSPVHTWSRSPSKSRSLSWEKRKDEPSTSNNISHKKKKDKKTKKKKKKDKK